MRGDNLALQPAAGEIAPSVSGWSDHFTRYWFASRGLILSWLLLSLWQIGAYPLTNDDAEAFGVLRGFRLASVFEDTSAAGSVFSDGWSLLAYLPTAIGAHMLPVNDFTLRLPYALVGAMQMPLLLAMTGRVFGRRAAAFAGLMLLGTGLFAINRLTVGTGLFITLELAGALCLLRYVELNERRWLILASLAFASATLVFAGGALLLAVALAFAFWKHRDHRDVGIASLAGVGMISAVAAMSVIATMIGSEGNISGISGDSTRFGFSITGFFGTWVVYVGIPVLLLILVGIAEAWIHRHSSERPVTRTAMFLLFGLSAAYTVPWLFLEPRLEHAVLVLPLLLAVAGFGWSRLIDQLSSVATQGVVAIAVAAIAMAGVVWQQAVFNPVTEFTAELDGLREYALSFEQARGIFETDDSAIRAVAHVLRTETEPDARIFVRDGASTGAISLYSARNAHSLDLELFDSAAAEFEGAYLVIKGEDESFNAGLSGVTTVVANHRIFSGGEVLYQVVEFSSTGEPFSAPIWWRAGATGNRLFHEHDHFTDYIPHRN